MPKEHIIARLNLEMFNENRNINRSSSSKCVVMGRERECKSVPGREQLVLRSATALQKVKRCHNERLGRGRGPRSQPMLGFVNRVKGLGYPMTKGTASWIFIL